MRRKLRQIAKEDAEKVPVQNFQLRVVFLALFKIV